MLMRVEKRRIMLPILTPTDFVAVVNQTFETALPDIIIEGELANYRVSKNRWVYFDLKDTGASVKHFGTVYMLPGPLEEGMLLRVRGRPYLHPQFGFSVNIKTIELSGEGTLKKAFELLLKQLTAEGLFDDDRKRELPYPPQRIGLVTSGESAAYADFIKILRTRWQGVEVELADVQVQGDPAPAQIVRAIEWFNKQAELPDVLVVIRGGGSADDLQAFSTEVVTRAVAASRIPTLVAIGHEVDTSLAELAADMRASTPSNAAELLVPDRAQVLEQLASSREVLGHGLQRVLALNRQSLEHRKTRLDQIIDTIVADRVRSLQAQKQLIELLNPQAALKRGYAIIRQGDGIIRSGRRVKKGDELTIDLQDAAIATEVKQVTIKSTRHIA